MLTDADIETCLHRFGDLHGRYELLARTVDAQCHVVVDDVLAVRAGVQWRVKSPASLRAKIVKNRAQYAGVDDFFSKISDLAGVRITAYRESDRALVVEALRQHFVPPPAGQAFVEVKDKHGFAQHYRAIHVQAGLRENWLKGEAAQSLRGMGCEIQVCSLLAHVYNEVEHDLQYKHLHGELSTAERQLLDELGQLTLRGDATIDTLLKATQARQISASGPFQDVHDFVARMSHAFEHPQHFARHSAPLFEVLQRLGLNTPQAVMAQALGGVALMQLFERLAPRVGNAGVAPPLEADTADVLLVALLPAWHTRMLNGRGARKTHGKPARLTQVAQAYAALLRADAQALPSPP